MNPNNLENCVYEMRIRGNAEYKRFNNQNKVFSKTKTKTFLVKFQYTKTIVTSLNLSV